MKIEVLGSGCKKCQELHALVERIATAKGVRAEIRKVETLDEILTYGVAFVPALVIDGEVKSAGALPKPAEVESWLVEATQSR